MGRPRHDLTNQRFGRLVALKWVTNRDTQNPKWLCLCDCGNRKEILAGSLVRGDTRSCGCLKRKDTAESAFKKLMRVYISNAKNRGYTFELGEEEFFDVTQRDCYWCGLKPQQIITSSSRLGQDEALSNGYNPYVYNGLDRLDNNKGYCMDNVVACCGMCNRIKSDMNEDEFIRWLVRVANKQDLL